MVKADHVAAIGSTIPFHLVHGAEIQPGIALV